MGPRCVGGAVRQASPPRSAKPRSDIAVDFRIPRSGAESSRRISTSRSAGSFRKRHGIRDGGRLVASSAQALDRSIAAFLLTAIIGHSDRPKADLPNGRIGSRVRVSLAQLCRDAALFTRGGELQVAGRGRGHLSAEPGRREVPSFKHLAGPGSPENWRWSGSGGRCRRQLSMVLEGGRP